MENKKLLIVEIGERIGNLRTIVRELLDKFAKRSAEVEKTGVCVHYDNDLKKDMLRTAIECGQLFGELADFNPSILNDEDLFALWETLYGIDLVNRLPDNEGAAKNLDMLKMVGTGRIKAFFDDYLMYTIGVDEKLSKDPESPLKLVLDIILEDKLDEMLSLIGFPKNVSIHKENGGIFITINAEDVPKLLARGRGKNELMDERASTRGKLGDVLGGMKN